MAEKDGFEPKRVPEGETSAGAEDGAKKHEGEAPKEEAPKGPWWREVTQPFVDGAEAAGAVGRQPSYLLEGSLLRHRPSGVYFNQYTA